MRHDLNDHRIAEIRTHTFQNRYPRVLGRNAQLGAHGVSLVSQAREIVTDKGAVGWGLSKAESCDVPDIVGRRVTELIDPASGILHPAAKALDLPLHDLAGAILGQPVHRFLGGAGPPDVICYDGGILISDLDPENAPRGVAGIIDDCIEDFALGYRAFKLKIGRGFRWMDPASGLRRDIEVTRAVREQFPDNLILVDANDGYTCADCMRYLDGVADCNLFWIEEPFRENREDLRRLVAFRDARCPQTLIADGESKPDIPFLLELGRERLIDVLVMDVNGFGFTGWRHLMPRLRELGIAASPHTWGQALKTNYVAQLSAGLGNIVLVEGIPALTDGVDRSAYRFQDGRLWVPPIASGFGLKLDCEA